MREKPEQKTLLLPKAGSSAARAVKYLTGRGIDAELVYFCISTERIYESDGRYHNVVFVGHDQKGKPRYANLRGIGSDFKGECNGSDKRFAFNIPAPGSDTLHLFESAIDLLSFATLRKLHSMAWSSDHLLSLAGIYQPKRNYPKALFRWL